jgi:hypothetical protein
MEVMPIELDFYGDDEIRVGYWFKAGMDKGFVQIEN